MANEITIQAAITIQRYSPATVATGELSITQTNLCSICNVQSVSTGGVSLQLGDCSSNLGYAFIKNLDATNYLQLTLDNSYTQIFAKLRPGEFCLVPVNQNSIYAKANTAAVQVMVCAVQT